MKESNNILQIEGLSIGYRPSVRQERIILSHIQLSAGKGELIALIGRNGTGKSTLLRTIVGVQPGFDGTILLSGKKAEDYSRGELSRMLSFVSTEIIRISHLSVYELVALSRFPYTGWVGRLNSNDKKIVIDSIHQVGIQSLLKKNITEISDGERQRVMIARALAQDTELIVLDEPTAYLDLPNKYEIIHLLGRICKDQNKTIIFSSHDLSSAINEADKFWLFTSGEIKEGAPEDLILSGKLSEVFGDTNLIFDIEKGEIRKKKTQRKKINLTGTDNFQYYWTVKALERLGYEVSDTGYEDNRSVSIINKNDKYIWCLKEKDQYYEYKNIYELASELKTINTDTQKHGLK